MKKATVTKLKATTRRAHTPKDLPLRAKSAKAVKGGLISAIVPCVKTIIPCVRTGIAFKG